MKTQILEEVWKIRREIEKENNNNLRSIFEKIRKKQTKNPSKYYSGRPKPLKNKKAA